MMGKFFTRLSYSPLQFVALLLLVACFALLLYVTAWVADDAYITFRTVDNFWNGYGLRWNILERVQTFTHPLWLLILLPLQGMTGEPYYTSLALSAICSLIAFGVLVIAIPRTYPLALLSASVLILSKAFVDYSTSGLENPLTHLLLGIFCWYYLRFQSHVSVLVFLAGSVVLNRLDLALIFIPVVAFKMYRQSFGSAIKVGVVSLLPLWVWEFFSLIYFGFFLPNTAIAKLNVDPSRAEILLQGTQYLLDSLVQDPVTLFVIVSATMLAIANRNQKALYLQAGVLLYLLYLVWVGGDFMSGRFLTAPLLVSLAVVCTTQILCVHRLAWGGVVLILILGLSSSQAPLYSNQLYHTTVTEIRDSHGIADERGYYYPTTGLTAVKRHGEPLHPWVEEGRAVEGRDAIVVRRSIGFFGYYAGPQVHVLDVYALGDPFLARLPHLSRQYLDEGTLLHWRIGHFRRPIPPGYIATLQTGQNRIADPALAKYYELLATVTQGDIWSADRWKAIAQLHTSAAKLLRHYHDNEENHYQDNWTAPKL